MGSRDLVAGRVLLLDGVSGRGAAPVGTAAEAWRGPCWGPVEGRAASVGTETKGMSSISSEPVDRRQTVPPSHLQLTSFSSSSFSLPKIDFVQKDLQCPALFLSTKVHDSNVTRK